MTSTTNTDLTRAEHVARLREAHIADLKALYVQLAKAAVLNEKLVAREQAAVDTFGQIDAARLGLTGGVFQPLFVNASGESRFESWKDYIAKTFGVRT